MIAAHQTALAVLFIPSLALGQPSSGSLVGSVDGDPMGYTCGEVDASGKMSCDFIQVMLSKRAKPEDLEKAISTVPQIIADPDGEFSELCKFGTGTYRDALARLLRGDTLEGSNRPPADPDDLDYYGRFVHVLDDFCQDRSAKNVEALLRLTHERLSKTCTAYINQYTQVFVKVSEKMWVAESSPTGTCGIVQASRFTLPEDGLGSLWEYTAQKIVTNKEGVTGGVMPCSDLNEEPVLYTWKSGPQRIDCEFID